MTDREMKKLSRTQLLEMLLIQSREVTRLKEELQEAKTALESRKICIDESGSIAEAALKLNGIFETAQAAADQYLQNIAQRYEIVRSQCQALEEQTRRNCEEMTRNAQAEAAAYWDAVREKIRDPFLDNESWQEILGVLEEKPGDPDKVRE